MVVEILENLVHISVLGNKEWTTSLFVFFFYSKLYFQALESKLASCRNFVKDQPREKKPGSQNPNSPRFVFM